MKALLLCGYRASEDGEPTLGLERDSDGVTLIDRKIVQLRNQGLKVVCVLAGKTADEQLRQSRRIESCELVFDTSEPHCGLLSNVRSATFSLENEACLILPVEIPSPERTIWNFLKETLMQNRYAREASFVQITDPEGAPWHFGFPLLLTRNGANLIRETSSLTSLIDPRLQYLHLDWQNQGELEQVENPL